MIVFNLKDVRCQQEHLTIDLCGCMFLLNALMIFLISSFSSLNLGLNLKLKLNVLS